MSTLSGVRRGSVSLQRWRLASSAPLAPLRPFLFLAGSNLEAACGEDECLHSFGHWIEWSLAVEWPIYAVAAWAFSAVVFSQRNGLPTPQVRER